MKVGEIAAAVGGSVKGNEEAEIHSVASLSEAQAGQLTFLANPKYSEQLAATNATAAIVGANVEDGPCALIQVENPDLAFSQAVQLLVPPPPQPAVGVHPQAFVHPEAKLADGVCVGACVVVEAGASIGAGTVLFPQSYVGYGAVLGEGCKLHPGSIVAYGVRLGARVTLQPHAVVGSDGFGYAWDGQSHVKIPQIGTVELGDDVEIGACTTIDRARFGKTVIGPGTKLDNQIQIAHNVKLGACCAFAAQVGISGSTSIGNGVLIGGQAGVAGHIEIGDGAVFSAKAGVTKTLPGGTHYSGYPARPHRVQLDEWRNIKALPRLRAQLREMEIRLEALEKAGETNEQ